MELFYVLYAIMTGKIVPTAGGIFSHHQAMKHKMAVMWCSANLRLTSAFT